MTVLNQAWSPSRAAFHGWRSRNAGSASAISTKRRRMKSIWIGTGFSHQSVPSLSNTATRSSTGTGSDPSVPVVVATNRRIASLAGPSRQLASVAVMDAALLTRHHRRRLALQVHVWLAADVDGDAVERAAREPVRRGAGVVVGDGVAAVASDAQPLAADRELARLRLDLALADPDVPVEQRQRAGRHAGRILARLLERGGQDQLLPGRQLLVGDDLLLDPADEAVDVVQAVVLDVEGVPSEARAVREQHALRPRLRDVHHRGDREGAVAEVHRLRLGHIGDAGVVDVAVARRRERRSRSGEELQGAAVVERERAVGAGLCVPEQDQLVELLGLLGGEVVHLGAVDVDVVELPGVLVEVPPAAERRVGGDGLPAVVPDAARAEHREELRLAGAGQGPGIEAVAHADTVEVALGVARERLGRLDAERVEDRRDEVDGVVVLLADLALGLDAGRPGDDARV